MKVAIVLLADTQTAGDMGRMANALTAVAEFKDAGDEVRLILDGAGVRWVGELSQPGHDYHDAYEAVRDRLTGVCAYCAEAFGVSEEVEAAGVAFAAEHRGHPSFRDLVAEGFQVITF